MKFVPTAGLPPGDVMVGGDECLEPAALVLQISEVSETIISALITARAENTAV
jgi:hypothetical protein